MRHADAMTYMGQPYYPKWLDNLADDVTLAAAAMDGTAHGPEGVRTIIGAARELYEAQDFKFAGPVGDYGFLEDYTTPVQGTQVGVIVTVAFNSAGQAQHIVVNHRPRSALLFFARLLLEKFAGTPLAKHWEGTP
jgi:hypothetical protein